MRAQIQRDGRAFAVAFGQDHDAGGIACARPRSQIGQKPQAFVALRQVGGDDENVRRIRPKARQGGVAGQNRDLTAQAVIQRRFPKHGPLWPRRNQRDSARLLGCAIARGGFGKAQRRFAPTAQFARRVPRAQQRAHPRKQCHLVHGLGQEIIGPCLKPGHLVVAIRQCGDQDHRDIGGFGIGLELAADIKPRHVRHDHIQQDQVGLCLARHAQGRGTTVGLIHGIAGRCQLDLHHDAVRGHIVYDQNSPCHARLSPATQHTLTRRPEM